VSLHWNSNRNKIIRKERVARSTRDMKLIVKYMIIMNINRVTTCFCRACSVRVRSPPTALTSQSSLSCSAMKRNFSSVLPLGELWYRGCMRCWGSVAEDGLLWSLERMYMSFAITCYHWNGEKAGSKNLSVRGKAKTPWNEGSCGFLQRKLAGLWRPTIS